MPSSKAIAVSGMDTANAEGHLRASFEKLCDGFEDEIRAHARIIASYRRAADEGFDDLIEGFDELLNMASETEDDVSPEILLRRLRDLTALMRLTRQDVQAGSAIAERLCTRLVRQMRQSEIGDRRSELRVPVRVPCRLNSAGQSIACRTYDLSGGGAKIELLESKRPSIAPGQDAELEIEGTGTIAAEIVGIHGNACHLAFRLSGFEVTQRVESISLSVGQYASRAERRLRDLCLSGIDNPAAKTLFDILASETIGLCALRLFTPGNSQQDEHRLPHLNMIDIWPPSPAVDTANTIQAAENAADFPQMDNPVIMTFQIAQGPYSQIQILADVAFAIRQIRAGVPEPAGAVLQ